MIRLVKAFATAEMWLLVLLLVALWRTRRLRRRKGVRGGWWALLAATVLYVLVTSRIVAALLYYSLESRCPQVSDEALGQLDAMVVLSGGVTPAGRFRPEPELTYVTRARVAGAVAAFERSSAEVLVTGGDLIAGTQISVGEVMRDYAVRLGVEAEKVRWQEKSRTTAEDATEAAALLGPGSGRRIAVVTSAIHMRRSERVFAKVFADDVIVAVPVDFQYVRPRWEVRTFVPSAGVFHQNTMAIHEYVGRLWYWLRHGA